VPELFSRGCRLDSLEVGTFLESCSWSLVGFGVVGVENCGYLEFCWSCGS